MLVAFTEAAVNVGAPVQLVKHVALLPATWNASTGQPVLEALITMEPLPAALLPGPAIVTSVVMAGPVSRMMNPGVGDGSRSGPTAPPPNTGAAAALNGLLV